jgi:glutathione S-transferase
MNTGSLGDKMYLEKLEDAVNILDKFLEGQTWTAGNNITIADYSIVATVSSIEVRILQFLLVLYTGYIYAMIIVSTCLSVHMSHVPN